MPKSLLIKQQEAKQRQLERNKISHKDQLSRLDSLFGKDLGAKKERNRLTALLNKKEEKKEEKKEKKEKKSDNKAEKKSKKKSKDVSDK